MPTLPYLFPLLRRAVRWDPPGRHHTTQLEGSATEETCRTRRHISAVVASCFTREMIRSSRGSAHKATLQYPKFPSQFSGQQHLQAIMYSLVAQNIPEKANMPGSSFPCRLPRQARRKIRNKALLCPQVTGRNCHVACISPASETQEPLKPVGWCDAVSRGKPALECAPVAFSFHLRLPQPYQ